MRYALMLAFAAGAFAQNIAVKGDTVHTAAGAPISNGVVLIRDGKVERVGPASQVQIPAGFQTLSAKVVTPGFVDAHSVVGLSGYQNQPQDQDQVERSSPMQPELRAIDAYDPNEKLVEFVRSLGVTTLHTGHGPGILVSGQTMIVKTRGNSPEAAVMVPVAMIAATLGDGARESQPGRSPGTRGKAIAMLRGEFIKAQDYADKLAKAEKGKEPPRDLRMEAFARVVKGELPLLVTVHRANDIISAIRLAKEFNLRLVLDGVAEAPMVLEEIKASGYPVIVHASQHRSDGDAENISFETASKLRTAGIPFALQTGYEAYVPKTRVLLWEAGIAAANGLSFDQALASITIDAARILGIDKRVGSLEPGKDGDLAMFDGDPFEYTTHCTGVVIEGKVVSSEKR
ncbi:MAG: amidohydrolase family protein [Bryobacteraceae bacterium]|nr:amidohydrolase family protein [Bryobacteraceae bacterium]